MAEPLGQKASCIWTIVGLLAILLPITAHACSGGREPIRVVAIEPHLELRLADGRLARLAGFDPAAQTPTTPDLEDRSASALAAMVVGRPASIELLAAAPDRWGRLVSRVSVTDAATTDLASAAIAAGLGRYRAEPAAHACRDDLLAAEDSARHASLGLWADPYYAVLAVDDRAAFAERAGTIVLAEGRLTAVLPGPFRTRLRFATRDGSYGGHGPSDHGLTATVLPHTMKTFEAQRVMLASLIGRTLRWRGLLDTRFGPGIELAGPDDVEVLPDAAVVPAHPN